MNRREFSLTTLCAAMVPYLPVLPEKAPLLEARFLPRDETPPGVIFIPATGLVDACVTTERSVEFSHSVYGGDPIAVCGPWASEATLEYLYPYPEVARSVLSSGVEVLVEAPPEMGILIPGVVVRYEVIAATYQVTRTRMHVRSTGPLIVLERKREIESGPRRIGRRRLLTPGRAR